MKELTVEEIKALTLDELMQYCHANAVDKGFWDGHDPTDESIVPEKIALMHAELSEALEHHRDGHAAHVTFIQGKGDVRLIPGQFDKTDKPDGVPVELADTIIRIFDLCGRLNIPLVDAIALKVAYNRTRPFRHGKVC